MCTKKTESLVLIFFFQRGIPLILLGSFNSDGSSPNKVIIDNGERFANPDVSYNTFPFPSRQQSLVEFNVGLWLWIFEVTVSEVLNYSLTQ